MLYNPTNLSINSLYVIKNAMLVNEFALKENLNLETLIETLNLDLTNQDTLKLYKMNQDLQNINNRVNFLIYKLLCLFNFLLSKKLDNQLIK